MRFSMNKILLHCTRIPKLFLTAQTVNPLRLPLHVPNESIADKHPINIQILCRKLRLRCQKILCIIFSIQDQVRYTVSWLHWSVYALYRQISHLTCPSPKSFVCNLSDSGRYVTSVFQGLSLSRSIGRVGENPGNEVALVDHFLLITLLIID